MYSYRNICYDHRKQEMHLFTWGNDGSRTEEVHPYRSYCYIEDNNSNDGISIYGNKLKKIEFDSTKKRREFCDITKRNFYNLQIEQQFLIENFKGLNKLDDFSVWPLKTYFLDIETFSPNGFPDPKLANDPIILISLWDSLLDCIYTFGVGQEYYTNDDRVVYKAFETEEEMLKAFIRFWRKDFPDVVSGWFSWGFDIPYICNRINKVYDDPEACNRLSPTGNVWKQENVEKRLGSEKKIYDQMWTIQGITSIDYQAAYIIFEKDKHESNSLNYICEEELNMGKIQHNAVSLSDLAKYDWNKFVDYNIQDVRLLVFLEDKKKYLKTCRELAYKGLTPFSQSLSTLGIVTGMVAQKALERNRIISTFSQHNEGKFEGGFVKFPKLGINKSLVYYDANSLYPNTIVTLNISPETKVGTIKRENGQVEITTVSNKKHVLTEEKFKEFIVTQSIAVSKYDVMFTQKTRGLFPDIIEEIYAKRVELKDKTKAWRVKKASMKDKESSEYKRIDFELQLFDSQQFTLKILMNRIYGYFAEKHSPLYDIDLAASVTLTGQSCVKEASLIIGQYMTNNGITEDCSVYSDTDSVIYTIDPLLQKRNEPFLINDSINPAVHKIGKEIKTKLDTDINVWAKNELNSIYCKYEFKQENITQTGIFLGKKRYILKIRDDEGIAVDKVKYTGVEVVSTKTPKKVKPIVKNIIDKLLKNADIKSLDKLLKEAYETFQTFTVEEISQSISVNKLDKYRLKCSGLKMGKGTPWNVKAALAFNLMLEHYNIQNKYESIKSGNKMKLFYVKPNSFNIDAMGFSYIFPPELNGVVQPDVEKMFEKTVFNQIERVFKCIGVRIKNPLSQETVDLFEFFGVEN